MGTKIYTVAECRALLATREGREELERAVARACGLDCHAHACRWARDKGGMRHNGPCLCETDFLTLGEGLSGYGDRCWEMLAALERSQAGVSLHLSTIAGPPKRWMVDIANTCWAATLADALCLALAAAGQLKKGDRDD